MLIPTSHASSSLSYSAFFPSNTQYTSHYPSILPVLVQRKMDLNVRALSPAVNKVFPCSRSGFPFLGAFPLVSIVFSHSCQVQCFGSKFFRLVLKGVKTGRSWCPVAWVGDLCICALKFYLFRTCLRDCWSPILITLLLLPLPLILVCWNKRASFGAFSSFYLLC